MSDRSSSVVSQSLCYVTCVRKLLQYHVVRVDLYVFFCLECFQCCHKIANIFHLERSGRYAHVSCTCTREDYSKLGRNN